MWVIAMGLVSCVNETLTLKLIDLNIQLAYVYDSFFFLEVVKQEDQSKK